jgi:hypothetical protein
MKGFLMTFAVDCRLVLARVQSSLAVSLGLLALVLLPAGGLAQTSEGRKPSVPPGYKLIEGDIQVPKDFTFSGPTPKAVYADNLWPNGVVPYEFDGNVSAAHQQAMLVAMAQWEAEANVTFTPKSWSDLYYIHIQHSDGNNSPVGRQLFSHDVNIFNWDTFIMAHELGHTLGFWHEHTRADRGSYIQINTANIQPDYRDQFSIHNEASHYGPYDFDSLMHYGQCDFSIDCPAGYGCSCTHVSITVLPPYDTQWQTRIGQRGHLSDWDKLVMSFLYPYANWRFVDGSYSGSEEGTFLRPYNTFGEGATDVPSGGTVWIQPGTYSAVGTYSKPMVLQAPLGGVVLGD